MRSLFSSFPPLLPAPHPPFLLFDDVKTMCDTASVCNTVTVGMMQQMAAK